MLRSAAKLSYQQAQAAIDGRADEPPARCSTRAEAALGRLCASKRARDERGPLDLDLPERKIC